MFVVILLRPQIVFDNQRVRARKICNSCCKKVSASVERCGVVHRVVGSVALAAELSLDLVVARPVQEVVAAHRVVAVGAAHQQPALGDDGEHPDVVLTILRALPLQVTRGLVLRAAGPVDPLKSEIWISENCAQNDLKASKVNVGRNNFPQADLDLSS